ncbi:MAG: hypothetical protein HN790_18945 [Methylococcales bacterium]|nr:hypothetical protein [Methylococcales bacterium]
MKTITLIRHSHADWSSPDIERPLTEAGRALAESTGQSLDQSAWHADHCAISPAVRTQQTAEILLSQIKKPITTRFEKSIYEASTENLFNLIQTTSNKISHLCIIGHNPGLTELANLFDSQHWVNLAPADVVMYQFETKHWEKVCTKTGQLKSLKNP